MRSRLYQIGKTFLHLPKLPHAKPKEEEDHHPAEDEPGPVNRRLATQNGPPKAVDHPHHRVDCVQQPLLVGHHGGAEPHWRDIQAELDDEGDDVAEVAVLHVEGGDPQTGTQTRKESHRHE